MVIATVALGIGIDCPDIRQVLHVGAPEDIESCVQETGMLEEMACNLLLYYYLLREDQGITWMLT